MHKIILSALLCFSERLCGGRNAAEGMCYMPQHFGACCADTERSLRKKSPDFSYAGNKYRQEWMVSWLQNPVRIRPAGMYYGDHIKPGPKSDEIDLSTLSIHVALSNADATAIAAELMKLKPHDDLIAKEKIEPGTITNRRAK